MTHFKGYSEEDEIELRGCVKIIGWVLIFALLILLALSFFFKGRPKTKSAISPTGEPVVQLITDKGVRPQVELEPHIPSTPRRLLVAERTKP